MQLDYFTKTFVFDSHDPHGPDKFAKEIDVWLNSFKDHMQVEGYVELGGRVVITVSTQAKKAK